MTNLFAKKAIGMVATTALVLAIAITTHDLADAAEFNFNWKGDTGYSAKGSFNYDTTTASSIISETGLGATKNLQSLSISFFDPFSTLINSFTPVLNGVSNYSFLRFNFDNTKEQIFGPFDVGKDDELPGDTWLNNNLALINQGFSDEVLAKEFGFNNRDAAGTKQILDLSNNSVQVSKVPEGSIIIGLLVVWSLGFTLKEKFNPKSKTCTERSRSI
ncbi:PEP-CTERM sorting domain-containing protein [Nostoc sp. UCD121]|uniref:PEP-CTERM sorting domain-containing protein n=1 Tax=unclassified Nostoc TaxID=2593658 RepID=UPI001629E713|nr:MULTISPECIES: PEP-CTERM sorting domain-containing protein [unclassified Nostoc]MBC1223317.1 PEP-CTERM sorting domain-containing protein [Nostoc sp. UCD120]MBC1276798.1 PEP-CTERM sorting domain-containing protein [Nostoc sp. UCD121]MBC1294200.1 PEP-CTERM sorting domain-containing protein [Nostoc sp. UCD122]